MWSHLSKRNSLRLRHPWLKVLVLTGFVILAAAAFGFRGLDWFVLKKSLRTRFSQISWITTQELADWLADRHRPHPVLLDVRTSEEWQVSHLPGARRVEPNAEPAVAAAGLAKDTPIVTYCSVGYRSGEVATRLRQAGFTRVENLEGSIFAWANENRPLVSEGGPVKTVHPYSSFWGSLLRDDVRAPMK
jgi:rhodanese-related sulfurtransferase